MGSLPNLHELGRESSPPTYRPGPALGHLCGGPNPSISKEEKTKILHRYSGHARITKARSNGNDSKIIYDDFMLEHMAAYSPISTRHGNVMRRRDSMSSSIGATSVRRLIAVVRSAAPNSTGSGNPGGGLMRQGTTHSRRLLITNLIVLCVTNLIVTAAFLPFLALQTSVSVWTTPVGGRLEPISINVGSLLLALVHCFAAASTLLGPALVKKLGTTWILVCAYAVFSCFYATHLHPTLYALVPLSVILGAVLGPLKCAQYSLLMTLATRISYVAEEDEDSKLYRRTCVIRRLARAFQGAHDFGLILGSVLSSLCIVYTINLTGQVQGHIYGDNVTDVNLTDYKATNCQLNVTNIDYSNNCTKAPLFVTAGDVYDYSAFLDDIFDTFEGQRLCGSQACPPDFDLKFNLTDDNYFHILPKSTQTVLAALYAFFCLLATVISVLGLDRIRMFVYQDPLERSEGLAALRAVIEAFRDVRLQMAAPLALFIGMEQAFMYADFSKSYVVCTLGIHRLNLVFLSMGILQSIAACTLSMLLRTIRRYYVVAVGFTFQMCLLMVLMLWKPIEDDPALFYVISASWGVCNAIWEMLHFTLLTWVYADNWEAAFANTVFFKFLGAAAFYVFHGTLCNYHKLYSLGFFMVVAVVPYVWLEIRLENLKKIKNITRL